MSILLLLISSELTSMILQTSPQTKLVSQTNNNADVINNDVVVLFRLTSTQGLRFSSHLLWELPMISAKAEETNAV